MRYGYSWYVAEYFPLNSIAVVWFCKEKRNNCMDTKFVSVRILQITRYSHCFGGGKAGEHLWKLTFVMDTRTKSLCSLIHWSYWLMCNTKVIRLNKFSIFSYMGFDFVRSTEIFFVQRNFVSACIHPFAICSVHQRLESLYESIESDWILPTQFPFYLWLSNAIRNVYRFSIYMYLVWYDW